MKKISLIVLGAAALTLVAGCNQPGDKFEYGKEVIMFTGTGITPIDGLSVDDSQTYTFTISATGKVDNDVTVYVELDPDAVEAYNTANKTTFTAVPEEYLALASSSVVIPEGRAVSGENTVTLTSTSFMEVGPTYVVPVTITKVEGADMDVLETSRTLFIRLKGSTQEPALKVASTTLYSNYPFGEDALVLDGAYTLEIKIWFDNVKSAVGDLVRICTWKDDDGGQMLLRLNENGTGWKVLDFVAPSGRYDTYMDSSTNQGTFEANKWYLVTMVWDGSQFAVYINGEKDNASINTVSGDQTLTFSRFEIGMSWAGYGSSQSFNGRLAEVRVWDVARSASQIAESQCYVDPATATGLVGYWKLNEGSGHIFKDSSGGGRDMDWSKSERDSGGNDVYVATPEAANAVQWVNDANNKCAQ